MSGKAHKWDGDTCEVCGTSYPNPFLSCLDLSYPMAIAGQPYKIEKGTWVSHIMKGWYQAGRTYTIKPNLVYTHNPNFIEITWAGSGGYWNDMYLSPDDGKPLTKDEYKLIQRKISNL